VLPEWRRLPPPPPPRKNVTPPPAEFSTARRLAPACQPDFIAASRKWVGGCGVYCSLAAGFLPDPLGELTAFPGYHSWTKKLCEGEKKRREKNLGKFVKEKGIKMAGNSGEKRRKEKQEKTWTDLILNFFFGGGGEGIETFRPDLHHSTSPTPRNTRSSSSLLLISFLFLILDFFLSFSGSLCFTL